VIGVQRTRAGLLAVVMVVGAVVASTTPVGAATPDLTFDAEAGTLAGTTASAGASSSTDAARNGTRGLRISATAAEGYVRWGSTVVPQGRTHSAVRVWVRVNSRAAGESVDVVTVGNALGSANFDLFVSGTNNRFRWDLFRDDWDETAWAIEFGRWYLVEALVEFEGTTHTASVRIDGEEQGTISSAGTATTVRQLTLGTTVAKTHQQDYDDLAFAVDDSSPGWLTTTPPSVTVTAPASGAVFSAGQMVTADFACSSAWFPIVTCSGTAAVGARVDTSVLGDRTFTVTAVDRAGHRRTVTRSYKVVDTTDPTVTLTSPADGERFARDRTVRVAYSCTDGQSGIAPGGCSGSEPDGGLLPTARLGTDTVTVQATDRAGNTTSVSHEYEVVPNRPDALVRPLVARRAVGDDVYSPSASGQTLLAEIGAGGRSYLVRVENDGLAADTFRLRGTGSDARWRVRWWSGGREVTRAVARGILRFRDLAPGAARTLKVTVTPTAVTARGAVHTLRLNVAAPRVRDAVAVLVRRA